MAGFVDGNVYGLDSGRLFGNDVSMAWAKGVTTRTLVRYETSCIVFQVIQLILWIVDSGCSKHMTGNLQLLRNFIEKFIGTARFGNDHFAGDDLLKASRDLNLYNISIFYMAAFSPVKSKKASIPPKLVPITESELELLHMDLCGPMRVASINGKKYILVIVDDYSWYTFVYFLRTKDEAPDMIIDFVNQVQRNLKAQILTIRTDNGTGFKKQKLCNRTLVEVARTMLIFSKAPEFLWAEAIATAYFTQNCSIIHTRQSKTPYELIRGRKPNVQYFHVFGYLCYPTNDRDDLGKIKPKADIGIFIGYSESSRGFRIHNQYLQSIPSKSDLDNLFGPLFEEYYSTSSHEVLDDSATNTTDNDYTSSSSSIIVDQDDAPPVVSSSDEQVANTPNSLVMNEVANEFVQNDVANFDGHMFHDAPQNPKFEVAESSSTY
ncbi:retrovirus-related pol polyprotein from transposon TNT 1-94 [Tanacetum coccineum]|uniref:Retrovirus-related pol polyprotein from transposon TNT 1-94 n=1 Tax=Tanacetum coccineum TaxID=301880 RepID=A0ABQ4WAP8_9ASTR